MKKGQNQIITGVLLIAISLAGILIIYNSVKPLLNEKSKEIGADYANFHAMLYGIPEGIIAYYKFDGNAKDETGNHNGTVYGAQFISDPVRSGVVNFNSGNHIDIGTSWLPTEDMAVSVWVYARSWGGENNGRILASKTGQKFYLDGEGDTRLTFTSSNDAHSAHSGQNMTLNQWKHLVINRLGADIYFYIDGSRADVGDSNGGTPRTGSFVFIGSSPSYDKTFDGYMDDLMIFNRALSEQEIQMLFNPLDTIPPSINFVSPTISNGNSTNDDFIEVNLSASDALTGNSPISEFIDFDGSLASWWRMDEDHGGIIYDYSIYGNNATVYGARYNPLGKLGGSYSFNGTTTVYLKANISSIQGLTDFTFSAWFKSPSISDRYIFSGALGNKTNGMYDNQIVVGFATSNAPRIMVNSNYSNDTMYDFYSPILYNDSLWHQLVVTRSYNNLSCYVDDFFIGSKIINSLPILVAEGGFVIGQDQDSVGGGFSASQAWNGSLDDVMIFKRALSKQEVAGLYANSSSKHLTVSYTGLEDRSYTFKAYAQDTSGNINSTETRKIEVDKERDVSGCGILSRARTTYKLTKDLSGAEVTANCINIKAPGITLDCQGHSIKNPTLEAPVIHSEADNATIRNCNVQASSQYFSSLNNGNGKGIEIIANNNTIENNTVTNTFWGIAIGGNDNLVQDNWVEGNSKGIHLTGQYNIIKNNLLKNNNKNQGWGLGVWNGYYNQFINNKVYGSNYGIVLYNAAHARLECEKYSNKLYIYDVPWYSWVTGTSNEDIIATGITYPSKYVGSGASFTELAGDCSKYFNSDLPIVLIDSFGATIVDASKILANFTLKYNSEGNNNRNFFTDPTNFSGPIGIKLRGQSSQWPNFPKKSYLFETREWNGANYTNFDVSLLNFPSDNDWILKGDWFDRTLLRNIVAYNLSNEIGRYAVRTKPVEVFEKNYTTGKFEYKGMSTFMENVKRGDNRVNIRKLEPTEIYGEDITGGYILSIDKTDYIIPQKPNEYFWTPNRNSDGKVVNETSPGPLVYNGTRYLYNYPDAEAIVPEQKEYIQNYMTEFEAVLAGPNFSDPVNGYAEYIDVDSFVDHLILVEFSKNADALKTSTYLHKDKNGKINMGPIWDFDLAFGNLGYWGGPESYGWQFQWVGSASDRKVPFWWKRLMQDPSFKQKFQNRWFELRNTTLNLTNVFTIIDLKASEINEAQQRHFEYWDTLNQENTYHTSCGSILLTWSSFPAGMNLDEGRTVAKNVTLCPKVWAGEIQLMKEYITARANWVDRNIMNL